MARARAIDAAVALFDRNGREGDQLCCRALWLCDAAWDVGER